MSDELNSELSPEDIKRILDSARKTALNVLSYADNTEKALYDKLKKKNYPEAIIQKVLAEMRSYGYLNEQRYILRAAEKLCCEKHYGKFKIIAELRKKGFRDDLISQLDFSDFDFVSECLYCLQKKGLPLEQKDVASVLRRGFSVSEVKAALAKLR